MKSPHLKPIEANIQFLAAGSLQHSVASAAGMSMSFLCSEITYKMISEPHIVSKWQGYTQ